jgi:hypothetical protein
MISRALLAIVLAGFCGCSGGDSIIKKDYKWASVRRIGVIPSKNNPKALAGVEDIFARYLMRGGFSVVERSKIEYLLSDQKMTLDGVFTAAPDGKAPGEILGVDAVLIVQIMAFNPSKKNYIVVGRTDRTETPVYRKETTKKPDGTVSESLKQVGARVSYRDKSVSQLSGYSAQVSVTARLVDAWSGEIIWVGSREGDGSSVLSAVENSAGYLSGRLASDIQKYSVKK